MRPHSECKLGKGFALPLAPNPVGKPAGFPTPFGWANPVLFCVEVECGRKPSAVRRVSEANLKVERFGEKAERLFRKISRPKHRSSSKSWFGAETGEGACGPLPLAPNPKGTILQALRASSPQGEPLNLFDSQPEGGGRGGTEIGEGQSPSPCPYPGRGDNPSVSLRADSSPYTGEPKGEADSTSLCVKRSELPLHRGAEGRSRQHFLARKEVRASFTQGSRRTKRRRRDGRSADSFRWTWWRRRGWICAGRRRGI